MNPSIKLFLLLLAIANLGTASLEEVCPENEFWDDCRSHCYPTCSAPHDSLSCITICIAGCACTEGYARDEKIGKCVKFVDCPGYKSEFLFIHQIHSNR